MKYKFPIITHINDVLLAIKDRDEFIVAERDEYDVVNYLVNMEDTFDIDENDVMENHGRMIAKGIMRRELRGVMFNKDGSVLSRPFHKFFNVGERADTQLSEIDFDQPHTILVKEDGSMLRPLLINGGVRWGTKMGVTDTAMQAEVFAARHLKYNNFSMKLIQEHKTPLFEYVGPENRIVLEYAQENLILLAVRDNHSGEYEDYSMVAADYGIPTVANIPAFDSLDSLVEYTRQMEGSEGFVITFSSGHRVKIKSDWYVRIHKVKDKIRTDRHVLSLILENGLDDILPHLDENDFNRVHTFEADFWRLYHAKKADLHKMYLNAVAEHGTDRKSIALEVVPTLGNKLDARFIFGQLDGKSVENMLLAQVKSNVGNTTKYENMMSWLKGE